MHIQNFVPRTMTRQLTEVGPICALPELVPRICDHTCLKSFVLPDVLG